MFDLLHDFTQSESKEESPDPISYERVPSHFAFLFSILKIYIEPK